MVVLLIVLAISSISNLIGILWQSLLIAEVVSKSSCCLCGVIGKEPRHRGLGWQLTRYSKERVHLIVITLVAGLMITYLLLRLIGILVALVTIALSVLIFTALQKSLGGAVGDLYGFILEISRVITLVLLSLLITAFS